MEKYLFNDGTNVVREVQSKEELKALAEQADPQKATVWVFHTSEWISYSQFRSRYLSQGSTVKQVPPVKVVAEKESPSTPQKRKAGRLWQWLAVIVAAVAILLVYNFTRLQWRSLPELSLKASRPANAPPIDADSLQAVLEGRRGTVLDKVTRTNLRIRNGWPDRILLSLRAQRDSSSAGIRFQPTEAVLDNATGYLIDDAVAELNIWRDGRSIHTEPIHFEKINYTEPGRRQLSGNYVGDSISIHFISIGSKAFNFCYSADKQSNYGNLNDRWFCR
ncbi:MAG: hypothetical protein ACK4E0_02880 [Chitinophagaceae bacterium]